MKSKPRGQALVEFALVIPVFLALLFGIIDLGRTVWASDVAGNAASEGARFAIVHGGSANDPCPVGPPAATITTIPIASPSCPYPSPSKQAIRNAALAMAIGIGSNPVIHVCYGRGCSGDTDTPNATDARGTPVTVTVSAQLHLTSGALLGITNIPVSATSTMVVNN